MRLIALLIMALVSRNVGAERIIDREDDSNRFYREALLVPASDFSVILLTKLSSNYLARLYGRYKLICVYFCVREQQAGPYLSGIGRTDGSFQIWLKQYKKNQELSKPFAQLLVIGNDAAIRYRGKDDTLRLIVLRGENPYVFSLGQYSCDLVNVAFVPQPKHTKESLGDKFGIDFLVKVSQSLDEELALRTLAHFLDRLRLPVVAVVLRTDAWFIQGEISPPVLTFFYGLSPPTEEDYRRSRTVSCSYYHGKYSCEELGVR